jgi:hypothetical protein
VFAVVFGLELATPTADHSYDAVVFAMSVEAAVGSGGPFLELFHPQHVAHMPAGAIVLALLQACGVHLGGMAVLQALGALGGGALCGLFVLRLAPLTRSVPLAVAGALALGASVGVWLYATDGECNMPALAFAVAALGPALRVLEGAGGRRAVVAGGVLLAAACALHLTLGTLWIAILAAALLRGRPGAPPEGRAILRDVVAMLAIASVLLAVAYVPRLVFLAKSPHGFSPLALVTFTGDSPSGGYLMSHPFHPGPELLEGLRGFATGGQGRCGASAVLRILPIAWLVAGAAALARSRRDVPLQVAFLWSAATLALYAAWSWRELEFTAFHLVPWAVLGTLGLAHWTHGARARAVVASACATLALLAALASFRCVIAPALDAGANPDLATADVVAELTRPGDRVIVTGTVRSRPKVYVPYFAQRAAIVPEFFFGPSIPPEESMRRLEEALAATCAAGGTLWALPDAIEDRPAPGARYPVEQVRRRLRELSPRGVGRGAPEIYRLDCPPGQPRLNYTRPP